MKRFGNFAGMKLKKAITQRGLTFARCEREAGIPARTLTQVNVGLRQLPKHHEKQLKKVFKNYGIKYIFKAES